MILQLFCGGDSGGDSKKIGIKKGFKRSQTFLLHLILRDVKGSEVMAYHVLSCSLY